MKIFTWLVLTCPLLFSQQPPQDDPIRDALFPPEVVMQNQQALGLSEEQKNFLRNEVRTAQPRFTEMQWKLQDDMDRLAALLKLPKIDENQVAAQLDKVLNGEREIKHAQLMLLVRIKNNLTAEQQTRLRDLTAKSRNR
jgi:Spy/CpxP family protein refolding chaperone